MRTLIMLFAAALVGVGCMDALGPAGGCAAEMRQVRETYGWPDRTDRTDGSGDYRETWTYVPRDGRPGRHVTFEWGSSFGRCVVQTATFAVDPILPN